MAVEVNLRGEFLRPGRPGDPRATATPRAFPRLAPPSHRRAGRRQPGPSLARLEDIRRRRRIRRLRQVGNAALWIAGSGVLSTLALGGLFGLH